jgi:hypothetical protein
MPIDIIGWGITEALLRKTQQRNTILCTPNRPLIIGTKDLEKLDIVILLYTGLASKLFQGINKFNTFRGSDLAFEHKFVIILHKKIL